MRKRGNTPRKSHSRHSMSLLRSDKLITQKQVQLALLLFCALAFIHSHEWRGNKPSIHITIIIPLVERIHCGAEHKLQRYAVQFVGSSLGSRQSDRVDPDDGQHTMTSLCASSNKLAVGLRSFLVVGGVIGPCNSLVDNIWVRFMSIGSRDPVACRRCCCILDGSSRERVANQASIVSAWGAIFETFIYGDIFGNAIFHRSTFSADASHTYPLHSIGSLADLIYELHGIVEVRENRRSIDRYIRAYI